MIDSFDFRSVVTPRLMRHFHLLNIPDLAVSTMQRIFSSIMQVVNLSMDCNLVRDMAEFVSAGIFGDLPVGLFGIVTTHRGRNPKHVQGNSGLS